MRRTAGAGILAATLALGACAAPGLPPGGPVDTKPPRLLKITPDTGTLNSRAREVVFQFDEVVSERPRGVASLAQLVVVSPSEGTVNVDWHRTSISVRPRKGWRSGTAYTVTILAGLSDLRGNALTQSLQTQFSTGATIPHGTVRGVAFDWVGQRVAQNTRIEATLGSDSLRYVAATDSAGRFSLTTLPPGQWRVRAYVDNNNNRLFDSTEVYDSATVTVADSARHDFYMFQHERVGPRASTVTVIDSMTIRVHFDRPINPAAPIDRSQISIWRKSDSALVAVARLTPAVAWDSLEARRKRVSADSALRADTSAAGRRQLARTDSLARARQVDSIVAAQAAAVRVARDTTSKRDSLPKPARAAPNSEYVVELAAPLVVSVPMRMEVRDAVGLAGVKYTSHPDFFRPKPPPPPAAKDSAATKAPPAKKPAPRDGRSATGRYRGPGSENHPMSHR